MAQGKLQPSRGNADLHMQIIASGLNWLIHSLHYLIQLNGDAAGPDVCFSLQSHLCQKVMVTPKFYVIRLLDAGLLC